MKRCGFLLSIMAGLVLGAIGTRSFAQQVPAADGVPVHMVVTVEARHGSDVPVINREDVMVHEGRDRDQVTDWVPAQGDHAGLEFFILIDESAGSSVGNQLGDIRKFIEGQPNSAEIGVAYMRDGTARIEQNLTSDHALAEKALRLPVGMVGSSASPYFSLTDLLKRWPASDSRREVVMVTDGIDRYYGGGDLLDPYLATAIEDAQRAGVIVSAIYTTGVGHFGHSYYRNYWGQIYLSKLTEETGGEAYYIGFTGPPVEYAPFLDDAAGRLKHQYILTFLAKPEKKAGMRAVKVTTEVPNAELVAAESVYVPAAR